MKTHKQLMHEYYLRNKDSINAKAKKWQKENPKARSKIVTRYLKKKHLELKKISPWIITFKSLKRKCVWAKTMLYVQRNITYDLTIEQLKNLWFRDRADLMVKPVLHRIDNDGNYTYENCKYIEAKEHSSIHHKLENGQWSKKFKACIKCERTNQRNGGFNCFK